MDNKILIFCNKYTEKVKSNAIIKRKKSEVEEKMAKISSTGYMSALMEDNTPNITFRVNVETHIPSQIKIGRDGDNLINLDQEDLDYLYKKYSKKLVKERDQRINSIKTEYENAL